MKRHWWRAGIDEYDAVVPSLPDYARQELHAMLVLLGNVATDDPDGQDRRGA